MGRGYLSPGGPDEVRALLEGIDLAGHTGLEFVCGCGGISLSLAADHGPA